MTTLRRDNGALGTRPLSRPRVKNSVVLSIPLKVVLTNGIARQRRYTVVTSSPPLMAEFVLPQTTEDINTVHRKPASTPPRGGRGCKTVDTIDLQLHCAKHLAWLGRGDLLQVPWCKRFPGLVVVVDLWSGFGSALYALLAAGNRVFALTTEHSVDGTEALLCAFPAAVHLKRVEDIRAEMLQPLLRRRSASVILVGGESPCHNLTSHQPHQLARLLQDITDLPEVQNTFTQVIGWLETTSSAPDEVKCEKDNLLIAQHFEIEASDFGWVNQNRALWVSFSSGSLESGINRLVKLWPDFFLLSSHSCCVTGFRLRFTGPKPIPTNVHIENGFSLNMDPRAVMETRVPALHPFTEEFLHWVDREDATVADDVIHRWRADGQRFSPHVYEARNLVWK